MSAKNGRRSSPAAELEGQQLDITRVLDAPRDLVWKAWTDPKYLSQWWGPHSFSNPRCDIDLRPGGAMNIDMRGPDGTIYPNRGVFREVVPPERLVFTGGVEDVFEVLTTVTFTATGPDKTTLHLNARVTHATADAAMYLKGMEEGWSQSLERLAEVATPTAEREIIATRIFNAPRELVFRMWTDPQHIAKWWGPNGFTNSIRKMEVRPGGEWAFTMHGPDGRNYDNTIVYTEVVRPERLAYDHQSTPPFHVTVTFTEHGNNQTRIAMHMLFDTAALRDNTAKAFGAVEGLQQTLGRLAKELDDMAQPENLFTIRRTFDVARDVMWNAWTDADRMARWFGPKGVEIVHSKNDLRPRGVYHYAMRAPNGKVMWGKWVYRQIVEPERLVFVSSFSDENGGVTRHPLSPSWPLEMLSTITFAEEGGKTTVTVQWEPINATAEERETFDNSHASMQGGWSGTFEQLGDYLATL